MSIRPGAFGHRQAVAATHSTAAAVGTEVLVRGGNAADAAVAMGFVLQVVEPHLNGPGGEVPMIVADGAEVTVLAGQGVAPAGATPEAFADLGLDAVPGTGLLAATVPAAFSTWLLLLERWGTWELADVLEPAVRLAERGHPLLPGAAAAIGAVAGHFEADWPSSAATWLTGAGAPAAGTLWRNPQLAAMFRRIIAESRGGPTRGLRLERARRAFMEGFVAEAIDRFARQPLPDDSGRSHAGLLRGGDLASWQPALEAPTYVEYQGWTVHKTGFWGQGPVFLQQLRLLDELGLPQTRFGSADYWHLVIEASKLAFADREAWYGDPVDGPDRAGLLSREYAAARAGLVGSRASHEVRPGWCDGRAPRLPVLQEFTADTVAGLGEPTVAAARPGAEPITAPSGRVRGDTCHLDVTDDRGLTISATPSGAWLQSSPTVPDLGFCLGTRAQMFWLERNLASTLAPGRRPRTTLSPSLARHQDGRVLSFGTPGGDQQDQWTLAMFLALVHGGLDVQDAVESPTLHHLHVPESFAPRRYAPAVVIAEPRVGDGELAELAARGHLIRTGPDWSLGRMTAVLRGPSTGSITAAADPRGAQAAAVAL